MKKKYRLRKNKDFRYAYKKGRSLGYPLFVMIFHKRTHHYKTRDYKVQDSTSKGCLSTDCLSRVGFSINKKFGNAVERNRIKRQLREIISQRTDRLKNGYDIIFIVRKNAKGAKFVELERGIDNLLKRGNLLLEENEIK